MPTRYWSEFGRLGFSAQIIDWCADAAMLKMQQRHDTVANISVCWPCTKMSLKRSPVSATWSNACVPTL